MSDGNELTKDNRMNVKLTFEKKFNVAAWEHEIYNITIEAPYDSLLAAKDMVRLLLPVVKNMRVVTIKAFKNEPAELPQQEVKKEQVKRKDEI
jgi:hypothetical protein